MWSMVGGAYDMVSTSNPVESEVEGIAPKRERLVPSARFKGGVCLPPSIIALCFEGMDKASFEGTMR